MHPDWPCRCLLKYEKLPAPLQSAGGAARCSGLSHRLADAAVFLQFPPLYGLVRLPDKRPASAPDEHKASHFIDLASMHIPGVLFYPISIIGIYFVLSLSDLSERIRPLAKVLAFLGRHSFDIMAIHFTLFKLIDFAYARFILKEIPETLSNFPVSFRYEMGPFYILIGLFLPALIGWYIDRIAAKFLF